MNFAAFLCGCLTKVLRVHIFLCCITWGDMLESWTNIQLRPTDGHKTAPKKVTTYICILKFAWSYGVHWERGNSIYILSDRRYLLSRLKTCAASQCVCPFFFWAFLDPRPTFWIWIIFLNLEFVIWKLIFISKLQIYYWD